LQSQKDACSALQTPLLTGFRFISELITKYEQADADFIFGFEESFGFLAGTFARDKGGVLAALLLCKAAQYYRSRGHSLLEVLEKLYDTHGYYLEGVKNIAFTGLDGMDKMKEIMTRWREKPIAVIGNLAVKYTDDYLSRTRTDAAGRASDIALPATDAIKLILEQSAWICIRPSGTEPKIKIYYAVCEPTREAAERMLKNIAAIFEKLI